MRILFGMPSPDSWGGPAACEPPFVRAVNDLGIDVVTETYVYGDKDRTTPTLSRLFRVVKTAIRFRRLIKSHLFDLVHLNTAFDKNTLLRDTVSIFLMGRNRPPLFLKIHGSGAHQIDPRSLLYRLLIKYLDKRVAGYGIFTREELGTFLPHGIDRKKFHFVKNVVEVEGSLSNKSLDKAPPDSFALVFVSRFVETKGLLETIEAVNIALENGAPVSLTCIGDGPIKNEAETLVKHFGISERVCFTGYIPEHQVDQKLAEADIFVFPTRHNEGFPIALFKAVAMGLPIVTTRIRAAAEYLTDPQNCLFCEFEPKDIASKIGTLIGNVELRRKTFAANREFGRDLLPENIAKEYFEIYKKIARKT